MSPKSSEPRKPHTAATPTRSFSASMKTTATPRASRSSSRGRASPNPISATNSQTLRKGTVSKDPRAKRPTTSTTRRTTSSTTSSSAGTGTTFKVKRRFQPPPPPPMYWICYDFSVKLCRGMCLGVGIGLLLTVVLPFLIDSGYEIYDAIAEAEYKWPDMSAYYSNFTIVNSTRIWRVDQESQARSDTTANLRGSLPQPTLDPKVVDLQKLTQSFPSGSRVDRTITLVHVGFTGGQTLLQTSSQLSCQEKHSKDPTQLASCLQQTYNLRNSTNSSPLAKQAKYYFHLGSKHDHQLEQSTSFLFTIRNPVDRILSVYADSHPLACDHTPKPTKPWGCTTREYSNLPDTDQYYFYSNCFPTNDPEEFAQAVKSPWMNNNNNNNGTTIQNNLMITSIEQQHSDCRWLAQQVVRGNTRLIALAPHMRYNYQYYWQQSMLQYPGKEVLAIRAEQEDADVALLQRLMMGGGVGVGGDLLSSLPNTSVQRSTPPPPPPAVSSQAYQKLCCVLHEEIALYQTILQQAANLPRYAKDETLDDLKQKCGVTTSDWEEWSVQCKTEMDVDSILLSP